MALTKRSAIWPGRVHSAARAILRRERRGWICSDVGAARQRSLVRLGVTMASHEVPQNGVWTRRWWRIPGETLLSQRVGNADVAVDFAWCNEREWGVKMRFERGEAQGFYDIDAESLVGFDEVGREIRALVAEQLHVRRQQITSNRSDAVDPIIAALAARFTVHEWTSGKRLRRETNLSIDEFTRRVRRLIPRYVRQSRFEEADEYSLTLPGVLAAQQLRARDVIDALYGAIATRFDADPDNEHFDAADLMKAGLSEQQLALAKNIARACLLIGAGDDPKRPDTFAIPADAENIAESKRKGRTFLEYLLHAACEAGKNDHFAVKRPWLTAPLWIGRDGSQPDYVPVALLRTVTVAKEDESSYTNADERFEAPGYELLEALPAGASGQVYRARENWEGGIERVVKIFIPHPFADEQDPEPRFRSEVQALYRLQHRAVVRYVSSGVLTTPRRAFYLVMELVSGQRLLSKYGSMPFETRVQTMIEVLGGLQHAHEARISHRDIKPSNIMIRDSDGLPVLVDFRRR